MSSPPPVPPSPQPSSSGGLEPNVAAALSYLVITAILWLVLEPYNKDRFVRFHSFQAIGLAVASFVISIVLSVIPILGWIILIFFPLVWLVVWILCMVKAFQGETFKLPVLGDFAEKQAGA
jgi:uncharacterized membrane protein